jgi:2-keto-3-deoxy-L-rhamnonate aldolase RhmA
MDNLDDILSVPGIDIAIIGNDDLTLGLGIPGQFDNPDYIAVIHRVINTCNRYGVLPGIACGDPEKIRFWKSQGMCAFWAAADVVSMWTYTRQQMATIRTKLENDRT